MFKKKIVWQDWKEPLEQLKSAEDEDTSLAGFPVLKTPFGLQAFKLHAPIKNDITFYLGNTNFDIGQTEANKISNTPGVETLELYSPYRFKFSPGKAFNHDAVKRSIEENLDCRSSFTLSKENKAKIDHELIDLKNSDNHWILYILPNGEFNTFSTPDKQEFNLMLKEFKKTQEEIGGKTLWGIKK